MGVTNEFERDLNNTAFLHRPGRIDMIVFQNVADCGDGSPGMQRAFRNYLHEGGMEKDLDVNSHSIINIDELVFPSATIHSSSGEIHLHPNTGNEDGNLIIHPIGSNTGTHLHLRNDVTANHGIFSMQIDGAVASLQSSLGGAGTAPDTLNINDADWDNINIGDASALISMNAVAISAAQFGWVGEMDQDVSQDQSPTFAGLSLTGNLVLAANSITGTSVDISNAELQQLSAIGANTISGTQWGYLGVLDQNLRTTDSPTFANPIVTNIYLADDIIHTGDENNLISFGTDTQDYQTGGSSRMDISDSGVRFGATGVRITTIEDNDVLGTSDTVLCTQGNVKDYVDKTPEIYPTIMMGRDGFVEDFDKGALWSCTVSDTDAMLVANFHVKIGGTFKLMIAYSNNPTNDGKTLNGVVNAMWDGHEGGMTWNIGDTAMNLPLCALNELKFAEFATDITPGNNNKVTVLWRKSDSGGTAEGTFHIFYMWLVRQ